MANPELIMDPIVAAVGGGAGLTGAVYFIRMIRRIIGAEKRDSASDAATNSLYENLVSENKRMASQMTEMSLQLHKLTTENHALSLQVTKLTIQIESLVEVQSANVDLQDRLALKDQTIGHLGSEIDRLNKLILGDPQ